MVNKKMIKNVLLEVEASCYNHEKYLQNIINEIFNDNDNNTKYIIARENNNNWLHLYKYSQVDFIDCLEYNHMLDDDYEINYEVILDYAQKNYIDYYVAEDLTNFINIKKFKKMLYNNKALLQKIIDDIACNVCNYSNNKYLINEYNLNKKLYYELKKIQKNNKRKEAKNYV